jgi:mannose-1-phosphate guanylyltransferase / mannose-6-phosphate isomerase
MSNTLKPVILCGGSGTRLWPLSRESFPKQFVPLINGQSLLALTIDRVKKLGLPACITNEEHRFFVQDLLAASLMSNRHAGSNILLEPAGRNTAAAMATAAMMPGITGTDLLLFLPSDHFVPDIDAFAATIQCGVVAAQAGYIVTFGVQPSFPSAAYGYIQQGTCLEDISDGSSSTYSVERFVEKPPADKAQEMLLAGGYLWNAGIFLCQASVLIDALSMHASDILQSCQSAMQEVQVDGAFVRPNKEAFLACRSESIDYAVMEHFDKVAVVPFKGAWSDVGSWNAVANLSPADATGNRINGQGLALQSTNTYINAPHRPVVALGTSDLVIVDTPDAVLVASADKVEQVKEVVAQLKKDGASQAVMHRRVARPWGWYDSIDMGERFQVKRIAVKPGASLSLQMHHHRAEHWIVVKGTAKVTNGEDIFLLEENQSTYIPIGTKHRLENPGKTDLEMIEVQSGDYLGEDDIVRFEDTYGRS